MRILGYRRYDSRVQDRNDARQPPRRPTRRRPRPALLRGDATAALLAEFIGFWAQVEAESEDGCWPWTGPVDADGYGVFRRAGHRTQAAHRYAFEVSVGPLPAFKQPLHRCGSKTCMNAWHMRLALPRPHYRDPLGPEALALGARLRALREARSLSANALSKRAGVSPALFAWLEAGKMRLTDRTRARLAAGLGLGADELARLLGA